MIRLRCRYRRQIEEKSAENVLHSLLCTMIRDFCECFPQNLNLRRETLPFSHCDQVRNALSYKTLARLLASTMAMPSPFVMNLRMVSSSPMRRRCLRLALLPTLRGHARRLLCVRRRGQARGRELVRQCQPLLLRVEGSSFRYRAMIGDREGLDRVGNRMQMSMAAAAGYTPSS